MSVEILENGAWPNESNCHKGLEMIEDNSTHDASYNILQKRLNIVNSQAKEMSMAGQMFLQRDAHEANGLVRCKAGFDNK
ncbi:uncharacterized protein Bfra_007031 [Botrytis fragariae]|uniref:Uncharacterized protein n=1 Tax=Botrytis fragariae TaxID=1964551 RepID=A0A8H6AHZ7_9HELO|nr:uncharacterized protein Bfra_007031 [Botrytis fragariae]KAF5867834.1 hypothetical protein Bfra_007031 [Botrytis fragariae]